MHYPVLVTLHLFAAFVFVGTVFFEVLVLEGARKHVSRDAMRETERAIGTRARKLMPWVILVLYCAGAGLAWNYRGVLQHPFQSGLGALMTLKIVLALSVLAHFVRAITWVASGNMTMQRSRFIHLSVFFHMVGIVLLAKMMFYVG